MSALDTPPMRLDGPSSSYEGQRFPKNERDAHIPRLLKQEIAGRAECGFARHPPLLIRRSLGVARRDLGQRLFDQLVHKVVGFDAESLAAGDFDIRTLAILFGKHETQLNAATRRERHHLI